MLKKDNHCGIASPHHSGYVTVEQCFSNSLRAVLRSEIESSFAGKRIINRQILHVEPNADCRFLVSTLLQLEDYWVTSTCTAEQAREIIGSKPFDAYILDNSPFDQSGIDLCQHICGLDANAVVIFYSGAAYPVNIERGLKAGAKEYLTKPCGIEVLTVTVARLIHSKQMSDRIVSDKCEVPRITIE